MPEAKTERAIEALLDILFSNDVGEIGTRLVLTRENGDVLDDLGGWSRDGVRGQLRLLLEADDA